LEPFPEFKHESKKWHCFNDMAIQVVDVNKELSVIKTFCGEKNVLVFKASIPALNHFYNVAK